MKLTFALLSIGVVVSMVATASGKCLPVEPNTDYYGGDADWHSDTGTGLAGREACAQLVIDNNGCAVHLGSHCWAKYGDACISSNIIASAKQRNAITQTATSTVFENFSWNSDNLRSRSVDNIKTCRTRCENNDKAGCCVFSPDPSGAGGTCDIKATADCTESAKVSDTGKFAILKNNQPGVTTTTWIGVEYDAAAPDLGPATSLADCEAKCRAADDVKCCTFLGAGCWAHEICPSESFKQKSGLALILKNECAVVTPSPAL